MLKLVEYPSLPFSAIGIVESPTVLGVKFAADTFLSPLNKPLIKFPNLLDETSSLFTVSEFTNDSLSLKDTEVDSLSEVLVN